MVDMRRTQIAVTAFTAGALIFAAGCSGPSGAGSQPSETKPAPSGLASIDPCKVLSQQELQAQGVSAQGEPVDQGIGEQMCEFEGDDFTLALVKAENSSLQYWDGQRGKMGVFEPNQVGSRQGIKMIATGSVGHGICNQVVDAGQGSVSVQVTYNASKKPGDDETCAKATEIAQVVEKKLQ